MNVMEVYGWLENHVLSSKLYGGLNLIWNFMEMVKEMKICYKQGNIGLKNAVSEEIRLRFFLAWWFYFIRRI